MYKKCIKSMVGSRLEQAVLYIQWRSSFPLRSRPRQHRLVPILTSGPAPSITTVYVRVCGSRRPRGRSPAAHRCRPSSPGTGRWCCTAPGPCRTRASPPPSPACPEPRSTGGTGVQNHITVRHERHVITHLFHFVVTHGFVRLVIMLSIYC